MFDRPALFKFKAMYPSAARNSAEAKQFLEFVDQKTKIDLSPFGRGDERLGWQA